MSSSFMMSEILKKVEPPTQEECAELEAKANAARQRNEEIYQKRFDEVQKEIEKKGVDVSGGLVVSPNNYEVLESENVSINSEPPPPLEPPPLQSMNNVRPNERIVTHRTDNQNSWILELGNHLSEIKKQIVEIQENQTRVANEQLGLVYKMLTKFAKIMESQLANSAKKVLEQDLSKEITSNLTSKIDNQSKRLNDLENKVDKLNKSIINIESLITKELSLDQKECLDTSDETQKTNKTQSDLGTLCMKMFSGIVGFDRCATQEDIAIIEHVFDLSLKVSNFKQDESVDRFTNWLNGFKFNCIEYELEKTPKSFLDYVKTLL